MNLLAWSCRCFGEGNIAPLPWNSLFLIMTSTVHQTMASSPAGAHEHQIDDSFQMYMAFLQRKQSEVSTALANYRKLLKQYVRRSSLIPHIL
jgi:hypothetical protein